MKVGSHQLSCPGSWSLSSGHFNMSPGLKCQVGSSPELQGFRGEHLSAFQPPSFFLPTKRRDACQGWKPAKASRWWRLLYIFRSDCSVFGGEPFIISWSQKRWSRPWLDVCSFLHFHKHHLHSEANLVIKTIIFPSPPKQHILFSVNFTENEMKSRGKW